MALPARRLGSADTPNAAYSAAHDDLTLALKLPNQAFPTQMRETSNDQETGNLPRAKLDHAYLVKEAAWKLKRHVPRIKQ